MSIQMTQLHDKYPISANLDRSVLKLTSVHQRVSWVRACDRHTEKIITQNDLIVYIDSSNKQRRVADCEDVFPAVLEGFYQYFRPHPPRLRSMYIERM